MLVPITVPPVATVYHRIVFPDEVAFKFALAPAQIVAVLVVTEVGAAGIGFTVTDLEADAVQPFAFVTVTM